ncbi:YlbL family protein [Lysinibacter cavernae]|uniref:endopeptidase La n=1 Tax=Lysinibacter cavernae TaxID=1640652 RepID=A0A7X5QYK9_9MICO|nr:PDZ domain-containing protein [Lysinibacter cavernae]NIH52363.1 PDZ domain-containing protein [Lysinibacter cavernae]
MINNNPGEFGEHGTPVVPSVPLTPEAIRQRKRRRVATAALVVAALSIGTLALLPSPYVIEQPGPVYNTLGTVTIDEKQEPMIKIEGAPTHKTTGELNLLTVSMIGNPDQSASWLSIGLAWFDPAKTVVPIEAVFPPNVTTKQRNEENQVLMEDSQQTAIAASLTAQKIDFISHLTVGSIADKMPAKDVLEVGDIITSANGTPVTDADQLRSIIDSNGTENPVELTIERDGEAKSVSLTPVEISSNTGQTAVVIGIGLMTQYEFPIDVTIQLDRVGGPSAGMMFALGITDKMTEGDLAGGENISGTGTISADGTVGAIGGARQKVFAAASAGSTVFLLPAGNCPDLGTGLPKGIEVFPVETLNDSLAILDAVSSKSDMGTFDRCPVG